MSYQSVDQYTNIWNGTIEYRSAKYYNIKNAGHNQNIKPGETVSYGFQASYNGKGADIPDEFKLVGDHLVVSRKDCVPKFEVVNSWNTGCIMNVSLYNNSDKNIEDWALDCDFDFDIDNIWRASIINHEGNHYIFKNCEYNSVIRPGETETFGMQIHFAENTAFKVPYNVTLRQYRKDDFYMDFDKNWNNTMIRSDDANVRAAAQKNKNTIKVCIVDSGIDWAIKKGVNIINISCGLSKDSKKLHNAIKRAYNKGILIIASAGAGKKIQYPAKYSEVMAVGAVKCDGTKMQDSPVAKEIEVVAPGEDVTTYGPFGILTNESGTSMAAPHVSALAALLWQQDKSKSADFIRKLITNTAHDLGESNKFGAGLIDCAYALQQYDNFSKSYSTAKLSAEVEDNDNPFMLFDDSVVRGFWKEGKHTMLVKDEVQVVKNGAVWPDKKKSSVKGMVAHPEFHGYFKKDYIASYIYMTKMAAQIYKKNKYLKTTSSFERQVKKAAQKGIKKYKIKGKEQKAAFIYDMALHTAADTFSHSTTGVSG